MNYLNQQIWKPQHHRGCINPINNQQSYLHTSPGTQYTTSKSNSIWNYVINMYINLNQPNITKVCAKIQYCTSLISCLLSKKPTWGRSPWARSSLARPPDWMSSRALWASLMLPWRKAHRPSWTIVRLYRICVGRSEWWMVSCKVEKIVLLCIIF